MLVNRYFIDCLAASAVASALYLSLYNPHIGSLLAFFSPAAIAWTTLKNGPATGLAAFALSTSFVMPFVSLPAAISFATGSSFPGFLMGILIGRHKSTIASCLITSAAVIAFSLFASTIHLKLAGLDTVTVMKYQISELVSETQTALTTLSHDSSGGPALDVNALLDFFTRLFPFMVFVTIFLQSSVNILMALFILSRRHSRFAGAMPEFHSFSVPELTIWALIPSIALQWAPSNAVRDLALNMSFLLLFFYLLQGLSIALHFLSRWKKAWPLRMVLIILFILQPYLLALPLLAGLVDFKFDLRGRWPIKHTES